LSGAPQHATGDFIARGMLLNVAACVGTIPARTSEKWAHDTLGFG
jgi:hypothetical protein